LLVLKGVRSLLVVGDLHGRYDNLETILRDRNNLKRVIDGEAHLVFTGDAVHPRSSQLNSDEAYEDSFCVMLLIMTLKAENPFNVHYMLGNHDNAHVGGRPVGRGDVQQDAVFERVLSRRFAPSVVERYREFVRNSPAAVRAEAADGSILLTHANVSPLVLNDQGLVNIFMQGRRAKALNDLLWLRDFDPGRVARDAARVGARLVVVGHTVPAAVNVSRYGFEPVHPPAFGRAGKTLLIVNAQCDVFGYLDVDLRQPLPADVVDLKAADGQPAMRVLAPKGARLDDDGR
jgi:hypothetical protein